MALDKQSPDIAQGVDSAPDKEQGAGDQGMMFGYACNETPELMPLPISLAHKLGLKLSELRHSGVLPWLQPDGKSQVTIEYRDGQPHRIHTIVISNQHSPDISQQDIRDAVIRQVCEPVVPKALVNGDIIYHVNPPAGSWWRPVAIAA